MKVLTTEKERQIVMTAPRRVSKTEKILFPIIVTIIVALTLPDAAILVGCLMMGNLMKESGVVERITKTAGNELMNIITIFLGFSVGCTTNAATFLNIQTVEIIVLGIVAFGVGTAGGVLLGKVMCVVTHGKINPLIGRPCFPEGRPGVQPPQLPAHARHGPQRCRCYRLRRCRWYPDQHVRLIKL